MSTSQLVALVGIILLVILAIFAYFFLTGEDVEIVNIDEDTTPTQEENVTPTASEQQTYTGEVIDVAATPVEYKNSLLVTVETNDGESNVFYIPEDVTVVGPEGTLERESISEGDTVAVTGISIEGGIEVVTITVTPAGENGDTPTVTITNTPTPTPSTSVQ